MQESRTKNALVNTLHGFMSKFINIIIPFITRTVVIKYLGMEYAGLNSLFTSILQVLNLAELGISSAVVYCMYEPMAKHDNEVLCALLQYMKRLYFVIGCVIIGLGFCLIPFLPKLINGDVPNDLNVVILYIIYLVNTGLGYFFNSYKSTLLNAGQKIGTISKINSIIILLQGLFQIVVLVVFKNYYLFLGAMPLFTIINNLCISWSVKTLYPEIICMGSIPESIKKDISTRVKGLFVTRICTTTRNAFDSIFISSFLGLTVVAIYGNYYYIMTAAINILNVITSSIAAGVGNSLVLESIEKNYHDMRKFNFIFNWIVGLCTAILLVAYQPFMQLWMGSENLFSYRVVILICLYFYFLNCGSIRAVYHDAAGLWWEARYRAILEAVLNIIFNIVFTARYGVFGTILGTLISLIVINYLYGTQIVFKYYFKGFSALEYYTDNLKYMITTTVSCLFIVNIIQYVNMSGVTLLFGSMIICFIIFNLIYMLVFCRSVLFKECINVVKNILQKKD